jgi:hypothetical protein
VEELQEEDVVKEQCRCNPTEKSSQGRINVSSQLSGLEDVVFNDFIKDDFITKGDCEVASGSASLPHPVVLETEEQRLERVQNENVLLLEALGDYKCDAGMSCRECDCG